MNDITITQPFHGLLESEGRNHTNWGLSRSTKPAVYVEPISYADVQAVVRDAQRFPSPVNPVGSLLSVTDTIVNDGGTMLCTRKLDDIIGLEVDNMGRQIVRVQARDAGLRNSICGYKRRAWKSRFRRKSVRLP